MRDEMSPESPNSPQPAGDDEDIIIIRDPEIDVEALMARVRANVAERRRAGAYREDLDSIADEVRAQVLGSLAAGELAGDTAAGFPLLQQLETRWLIREPDFKSNASLVGPLIVGARRAWNWMSTKWYVRGILDQQVAYNALVTQALAELHRANVALAAEVAELRASCSAQVEEIRVLRERAGLPSDRGEDRSAGS
jgi:hypothetical protein